MLEAHRLIVGAHGWDHADWNGTFYPEDLPEEWRLNYYSNEFSGVLVPEVVWRKADPEVVAGWCDEVAEGFLFFLESAGSGESDRPVTAYQDLFGLHWGGVPIADIAVMSAEQKWDLRRLRERFELLMAQQEGVVVPGFFVGGNPPNIERLREARLLADML